MSAALVELSMSVDSARRTIADHISVCRRWRKAASDTVIFLAHSYKSEDETAALAIVLSDQFLAAEIHGLRNHAQISENMDIAGHLRPAELVASACFVIAMKMKNPVAPCFVDILRMIGSDSNISDLSQCEIYILEKLDWQVNATTG
jgi:hypothetical protein